MADSPPTKMTRRQFARFCLVAGTPAALVAVLPSCRRARRRAGVLNPQDVPVRNPAFVRQPGRKGFVIAANGSRADEIAFRLDEEAAYVWEKVATVSEFRRGGGRTVAEILDTAVREYADRGSSLVHREVMAFMARATRAGVMLQPNSRLSVIRDGA